MLSPVGEERKDLHRSVLDRGGLVFDGHRGQRSGSQSGTKITARSDRVANLQSGYVRDPNEAALDASGPLGGFLTTSKPNDG